MLIALVNADSSVLVESAGSDFIVAGSGWMRIVRTEDGMIAVEPPVYWAEEMQLPGFDTFDIHELTCGGTQCYVYWGGCNYSDGTCGEVSCGGGTILVDMDTGEWSTLDDKDPVNETGLWIDEGYLSLGYSITCDEDGNGIYQIEGSLSSGMSTTPVFTIDTMGYGYDAKIISNGSDFLVYWKDGGLRAARVSGTDFTVLDSKPIEIGSPDTDNRNIEFLTMETNGNNYLAVWVDYPFIGAEAESYTYTALIRSADGSVTAPRILSDDENYLLPVDAAAGGGQFFVLESTESEMKGTWFSGEDGTAISTVSFAAPEEELTVTNNQSGARTASDGDHYLTVWSDSRGFNETGYDIHAAVFDSSGQRLTDESILVTDAPGDQQFPDVAYDGTNFWVVWRDSNNTNADRYNIFATRISGKEWDVMGDKPVQVNRSPILDDRYGWSAGGIPKIEILGDAMLVAWDAPVGEESALFGARLSLETEEHLDSDDIFIANGDLEDVTGKEGVVYAVGRGSESAATKSFATEISATDDGRMTIDEIFIQPTDTEDAPYLAASGSQLLIAQESGQLLLQSMDATPNNGTATAVDTTSADIDFTIASFSILGDIGIVIYQDRQSALKGTVIRSITGPSPTAEPSFYIEKGLVDFDSVIETNGVDFMVTYTKYTTVSHTQTRTITVTDDNTIDGEDSDPSSNRKSIEPSPATEPEASENAASGNGCSTAPFGSPKASVIDTLRAILFL